MAYTNPNPDLLHDHSYTVSLAYLSTSHLLSTLSLSQPPIQTLNKSPYQSSHYLHTLLSTTGVFFVTRMDGVVDIWDYFYRQNEVAYSHKVGDCMLSSMAVQGNYHR